MAQPRNIHSPQLPQIPRMQTRVLRNHHPPRHHIPHIILISIHIPQRIRIKLLKPISESVSSARRRCNAEVDLAVAEGLGLVEGAEEDAPLGLQDARALAELQELRGSEGVQEHVHEGFALRVVAGGQQGDEPTVHFAGVVYLGRWVWWA